MIRTILIKNSARPSYYQPVCSGLVRLPDLSWDKDGRGGGSDRLAAKARPYAQAILVVEDDKALSSSDHP